jgi:hypothetical protein
MFCHTGLVCVVVIVGASSPPTPPRWTGRGDKVAAQGTLPGKLGAPYDPVSLMGPPWVNLRLPLSPRGEGAGG